LSSLEQWDPLQESIDSPELISLSRKREIKNIIQSYTGWFDHIPELIQNALDAIDGKSQEHHDFQPMIEITLNLKENSIRVTDNGLGLKEDQIKFFIRPHPQN